MNLFLLINREFKLSIKNFKNALFNIFFFVISSFIFFLSLGSEFEAIIEFSHGIIWSVLLFSLIFSVDQFYDADFKDGSLKELKILGYSSVEIIISKLLTMWFFIALPIIIIAPLILYSFFGVYPYIKTLIISLF